MNKFPFFKQPDQMDCGPTCLKMIGKFYGRNFNLQTLRHLCEINRSGVSFLELSKAAEKIGFRALGVKIDVHLLNKAHLPIIIHWKQNHYVVLYKIKGRNYYVADPAHGCLKFSENEFRANWIYDENDREGIALLLTPTPSFYTLEDEKQENIKWGYLLRYLISYKSLAIQLILGLLVGSVLQLIVPFLTQSIVDIGVNTQNLNFITLILFAQIALIIGRVSVEFIRSWLLLHISTRVNISILTDFLTKLMKLPLSFFDTKVTGDILQRMTDQHNIEEFLTNSTLSIIFSLFNLVLFSIVLAYYNLSIFFTFAICSTLYTLWLFLFLKRRRFLNYKSFDIGAKNQNAVVQLVTGMQEIKLNNCEQQKRWEWEHIQARLFKLKVKLLALSQYQQGGGTLINEGKNIIITFLSAKAVINGNLTFGAMVAIQYIVGQLNSPIDQFLLFIQSFQDARISLERLNEIHELKDEESENKEFSYILPKDKSLIIKELSFGYPGSELLIDKMNLVIPSGKTTAIVGISGSGKTTLLKLLLRFYSPQHGNIFVGSTSIDGIAYKTWREECGVVMQDGFIFSDNIEKNIVVNEDRPNSDRLKHAIQTANLQDYIDSLPLGLKTKIGADGNGISQGQRQRILIARAVYKNPTYIFFDEATNALDTNNERVIMENLDNFFIGKTVVVVAHRLSTVKNANNIVVLKNGKIVEQGTHKELIALKSDYYNLVRNQLELGS